MAAAINKLKETLAETLPNHRFIDIGIHAGSHYVELDGDCPLNTEEAVKLATVLQKADGMNEMLPKNILNQVVTTLARHHHSVEISYDDEHSSILYDLRISMKSHLWLVMHGSKLMAYTRYDSPKQINNLSDLLEIYTYWFEDAKSRGWGKIYLSNAWKALYTIAGITPPEDSK